MTRKKEIATNFILGTICGLILITSVLTLFTIYWETKGLGSVSIGKGVFTAYKLIARVPGKDYILFLKPGVIWYALLFGIGNALASEGARLLIGRV